MSVRKKKFMVFALIAIPILLIFFYSCWFYIRYPETQKLYPVPGIIGLALLFLMYGIGILLFPEKAAELINRGSFKLYNFNKKNVKVFGLLLLAVSFIILCSQIYSYGGLLELSKAMIKIVNHRPDLS